MQRIVALVRERDVATVVVGLPLSLSGDEGPQALLTREWAGRLAARLAPGVPVELHDERLTTAQAARTGGSADEDSRAAAHLLEAYLAAGARA
jgi:putative Holliday junction resolvase